MRIQMLAALALALFCTAAGAQQPGPLQAVAPECSDDRGTDRCSAEQHRRVLALFGLEPIETHLAAGGQVRRVFYVDGYGRDVAAITFERRPERDPMMSVHFPRSEGAAPRPPMEAQVPEPLFREIMAASEGFERDLAPLPRGSSDAICMHSWVYTVEAADPPRGYERARTLRKTQDACGVSMAARFAHSVYTRAVPLLPHCALLDEDIYRNALTLLQSCSLLTGDRSAAAGAMNAAVPLRWSSEPDDTARVKRLFATRGTIDWNGERVSGLQGAAGTIWVDRVSTVRGTDLAIERMHGLASDRVRLEGRLVRRSQNAADETVYHEAPVTMNWVFAGTQQWEIESATVGAFSPMRPQGAARR